MADTLEFFFSGGTRGAYAEKQKSGWKPGLIAISVDGNSYSFFRHPFNVTEIDNKAYWGIAISQCKKNQEKNAFYLLTAIKQFGIMVVIKKREDLRKKILKQAKLLLY